MCCLERWVVRAHALAWHLGSHRGRISSRGRGLGGGSGPMQLPGAVGRGRLGPMRSPGTVVLRFRGPMPSPGTVVMIIGPDVLSAPAGITDAIDFKIVVHNFV